MRPTTKTTNLTPARTDLIGRDLEVARLRELFEESRLVTIVGIGGTGKTRLAREFGAVAVPDFPGGVWMVELANFDGVDDAMRELAEMLGLGFAGPSSSVAPIIEALRNKPRTLLIFDNLEHIVDAIADPIARIIDSTKDVCVLGTSREPIRIAGEQRFKLAPLGHEAAVKLFVRRATEVIPNFTLDDTNRVAIETLVDQLDRLPLAIELAASRIHVLPPQKLVGRLTERMPALRARDRDRPERHETLSAAIEWSWELLEPHQRLGLARCSVFRGGFSVEALASVVDYDGTPEDLVEDLIERSLIEFEDTVGGRRFYLFELVRRAAEHKLTEMGEQELLIRRHATYFAELIDTTPPQRIYERQSDLPNLLVAMRRVTGPLRAEVAVATAKVLRLTAAVPLIEETLSELLTEEHDEPMLARLFLYRGLAALERRAFDDALRDIDRAAELARGSDVAETLADALSARGLALSQLGRHDEAVAVLEESLRCARESNDARLETMALTTLATAHAARGERPLAETLFEQALARCRAAGDDVLTGRALLDLARCQADQGRWPEALANINDALTYLDQVEDDRKRGVAYIHLGEIEARLGNDGGAVAAFEMGRQIAHALGWKEGETTALIGLGELGDDASDRTYLVQAVQLNEGAAHFEDEARPRSHLALRDLLGHRHAFARPQLRRTIGVIGEQDERWAGLLWGYLGLSYAATHEEGPMEDSLRMMRDAWKNDEALTPLRRTFDEAALLFAQGTSASAEELAELRERLEGGGGAESPTERWPTHRPVETLRRLVDATFGAAGASVLAVSRDGRRFVPPGGEEVDFSRRGPLRKIIIALAEAREERPGQGLSADDVLEAGWPGDIVTAEAGAARVYSAVRTLRTHGLEEILLTQDDGYLIDPDVSIDWLD